MPTGPFGFKRITNIGPFTNVDAEQEFKRIVDEDEIITRNSTSREISSIHGIDLDNVTFVKAKLIVRESLEEGDEIIDRIKREVDIVTRDNRIATMRYWFDEESSVAKIIDVGVDSEFRRKGLGTKIKEKEEKFMQENNIDLVYTNIISQGGYRLARKTGFRPIHEADHLINTEAQFTFNNQRGVMFKYI